VLNKNAFLFAGGRRFCGFCICYTKRLSSSKVYPGGNNNCCCGVVWNHFLNDDKLSRIKFKMQEKRIIFFIGIKTPAKQGYNFTMHA